MGCIQDEQEDEETQEKTSNNVLIHFHPELVSSSIMPLFLLTSAVSGLDGSYLPEELYSMTLHTPVSLVWLVAVL